MRSILKASTKGSSNIQNSTSKDEETFIESTPISSKYPKLKREEHFKVKRVPRTQAIQQDHKSETDHKDESNKNENEEVPRLNEELFPPKIKLKDDFTDNLSSDSYHKSFNVNSQPLPTHMKRILENAMESVPKLDRERSLQNVSENRKSKIDVNQACQILDNISEHTKQRDNGNVCRHGMFLTNCTVCKALVEIQQRLKFNIKKHVGDKFHWNLLPRMQDNGKIKWPITSADSTDGTAVAITTNAVGKKSVKLPALQSTITMAELKRLRRKKKREVKDNKSVPVEKSMQQPPAVQTITFEGKGRIKTEVSGQVCDELASQRRKKKVTFAERNIYKQMIGYKA